MQPVVALLHADPASPGNGRFEQEAAALGLKVEVYDPMRFDLVVQASGAKAYYRNEPFIPPAAFIPRSGSSTAFGRAIVAQVEAMPGVVVINRAEALARSRDKLLTHQLLAAAGVPFPRTVLSHRQSDLARLIREVDGPPAVLKLVSGTHGRGVMLGRELEEIQATLETIWALDETLLIQEFVRGSEGRDIRVIVVGGKCLGAMERTAELGRFRANVHQGASVRAFPMDERLEWLALRTTETMGLDIAGVDILEGANGYVVIEANAAPGFEGFERATGVNVAAEILKYAKFRIGG